MLYDNDVSSAGMFRNNRKFCKMTSVHKSFLRNEFDLIFLLPIKCPWSGHQIMQNRASRIHYAGIRVYLHASGFILHAYGISMLRRSILWVANEKNCIAFRRNAL